MEKEPLIGKVRKNGFYNDCVPMVQIHAPDPTNCMNIGEGERRDITIIIGGIKYIAGIRYWPRSSELKVCQDIKGFDGLEYRLADLLSKTGTVPNSKVSLNIRNDSIEVLNL